MRLALSFAMSVLLLAVPFSGARADTLAGTMIKAYQNSRLLEANRAVLRARDEGVAQAVSALRPALDLTAGIVTSGAFNTSLGLGAVGTRHSLSANVGLSAQLLLFDSGRTAAAIGAAEQSVLAARQTLIEVESQVLLGAVSAYLNMLRDQQFVQLEENNLRLIRREVQAARDRFEVGETTRTDVSLAEARLAAARASLAARQGNLEISREAFNLAVGAYPGRLAPPPARPRIPNTLDAAKALARENHPSIKRAQFNVAAADFNLARAEADMKPSVALTGQVGLSSTANNLPSQNVQVGIQAQVPLYQGGRRLSLQRQAFANAEAARAELQQTALQVQQGVANAWAQLQIARATIVARREQVRAASLAFEGAREEAALGARTTLDVLNAEQQLLEARTNLIAAERDEYVAVYAVLSASGLLTVRHLGLRVPGYDPEANYRLVRNAPALGRQGARIDRVLERANR